MFNLIIPLISSSLLLILFAFLLWRKLKQNLFLELGFLYLSFIVLYTIAPGIGLIFVELNPGLNVGMMITNYLDSNNGALTFHLWRHFLFGFSFSISYYLFRGNRQILGTKIDQRETLSIYLLISIIIFGFLFLFLLSAPVDGYLENYTRYDHLPNYLRIFVSLIIRFKAGFYTILLTLLFAQYRSNKTLILFVVLTLCALEILYSYGSRIYSFVILLQVFFLYSYFVKTLSIKRVLISIVFLLTLFSVIEIVRLQDVKSIGLKGSLDDKTIGLPTELGAVFIPSFLLYQEREQNNLPKRDWQMFFYDFISPFTRNSDTKWNPMWWYANNYYPKSEVPPFTLGPIAESAVWGGEFDLILRGLLNGVFFATIVKWFIRRRQKFWAVSVYVYCFSFAIITVKYSIFFYLTPFLKELLPTILITKLLIFIVSAIFNGNSKLNSKSIRTIN